jgi:hypothetical protein
MPWICPDCGNDCNDETKNSCLCGYNVNELSHTKQINQVTPQKPQRASEVTTEDMPLWFYALNDEKNGPITYDSIKQLIKDEIISRNTLVWRQGMSRWEPSEQTNLKIFFRNIPPVIPNKENYSTEKILTPPLSHDEVKHPLNNSASINNQEKSTKMWSWKLLLVSFFMSALLNVVIAKAIGEKPAKNIIWTVFWLYLSLYSWRYWSWKALLPYPSFIIISLLVSLGVVSSGGSPTSALITGVFLNIICLGVFAYMVQAAEQSMGS